MVFRHGLLQNSIIWVRVCAVVVVFGRRHAIRSTLGICSLAQLLLRVAQYPVVGRRFPTRVVSMCGVKACQVSESHNICVHGCCVVWSTACHHVGMGNVSPAHLWLHVIQPLPYTTLSDGRPDPVAVDENGEEEACLDEDAQDAGTEQSDEVVEHLFDGEAQDDLSEADRVWAIRGKAFV